MGKSEEQTIREKIILATINCIEKDGLDALTTRGIAREAGINNAAIHYYFGTKENLLAAAMQQTLENAFKEPEEALTKQEGNFRENLRTVLLEHLEGMLRYPNITKAHFYEPFVHNNYEGLSANRAQDYFDLLIKHIEPRDGETEKEKVLMALVQLMSAIFFPGILPGLFGRLHLDFNKAETREKYVDYLLEHYPGII